MVANAALVYLERPDDDRHDRSEYQGNSQYFECAGHHLFPGVYWGDRVQAKCYRSLYVGHLASTIHTSFTSFKVATHHLCKGRWVRMKIRVYAWLGTVCASATLRATGGEATEPTAASTSRRTTILINTFSTLTVDHVFALIPDTETFHSTHGDYHLNRPVGEAVAELLRTRNPWCTIVGGRDERPPGMPAAHWERVRDGFAAGRSAPDARADKFESEVRDFLWRLFNRQGKPNLREHVLMSGIAGIQRARASATSTSAVWRL